MRLPAWPLDPVSCAFIREAIEVDRRAATYLAELTGAAGVPVLPRPLT
jgi:hypothetical protein